MVLITVFIISLSINRITSGSRPLFQHTKTLDKQYISIWNNRYRADRLAPQQQPINVLLSSFSLFLPSLCAPTWTASSFSGSLPSPLLIYFHSSSTLFIFSLDFVYPFPPSLHNCQSYVSSFLFPSCYSRISPIAISAMDKDKDTRHKP